MNNPLSIILGEPEFGWLSIDIIWEGYKFNIDASDAPINPLELLCDVLLNLKIINKGEVLCNPEGAYIFLEFEKTDQNYQLAILTDYNPKVLRTREKTFSGNFQEIIEPFITALTLFYSKTYDINHWPDIDLEKINKLQFLKADMNCDEPLS